MLWNQYLLEDELSDLKAKGALKLGHLMKRYSRGRSGQWHPIKHTKLYLDELEQFELILVGSKNSSDNDGVFYLKNAEKSFLLNGRASYGAFLFGGDRVVIGQEIYDFKIHYQDQAHYSILDQQAILSDEVVLLEGETGTGKGYLAQKIVTLRNPLKPWVHINLAALAPSLLESEIFGHVKGAFTGACYDNKGAIKSADRSVLFLDEIDSLPLELQTKLLLFLDDYRFRSVGSMREERAQLKLIVASGKILSSLVEEGLFRKDLYYRLTSGYCYQLPTLRDHPNLIKNFCLEYAQNYHLVIEPNLVRYYEKLSWPGNYRELKAHLDRKRKIPTSGGNFCYDEWDEKLLTKYPSVEEAIPKWNQDLLSMDELKKNYAKLVFHRLGGNFFEACSILKISIKTLKLLIS